MSSPESPQIILVYISSLCDQNSLFNKRTFYLENQCILIAGQFDPGGGFRYKKSLAVLVLKMKKVLSEMFEM